MAKSLLEQLPDIVANGRKQAEKILEGIESRQRISLQTREVVLPARDTKAEDWMNSQNKANQREVFAPGQASLVDNAQPTFGAAHESTPWANRLIYGDNLMAMAALLAGDENTPSLRGKVDLIYIDPPFDSKADGLPAFYSPDFLVRTESAVYLVETKGQEQTIHPNVQRKLKAALAWCERINNLTEEQRDGPPWHYVLLAENVLYEW